MRDNELKIEVLHKMKKIFYEKKTNNIDWMGNLITEENKPSYHHIEKAEDLRKKAEIDIATIDNGAYLGKLSHEQLHRIETLDVDLYIAWNELFRKINDKKTYITEDIWKEIFELKELTDKIDKKNNNKLHL